MFRAALLLACLASASAFAPSAILPRAGARAAKAVGPKMQASESVPFLSKPPRLDSSLPGYAGFDPIRLSDTFDVKWLLEAELKNGRVAMLGVVGLIVPEFFHLPFYKAGATAYENFFTVPGAAIFQIFLGIGAVEIWSHGFKITPEEMFKDGRVPGKFGFDPLGFGKDPAAFKTLQLKEVKNGRLAMLAFGGLFHQQLFSKTGSIAFLGDFKPLHF